MGQHDIAKAKHVKVVIRTRPTSEFAHDLIRFDNDQKNIHIHIPKGSDGGFINNQQENWDFRFDSILHNSSQEKVYDDCGSQITKSFMEGYHGTIMAYGQTGAGKTFTMTGATENYKHRGLIPRAISHVYREIAERPQMAYTVRISYLEIYNEQIVDLLATLPDAASMSADGTLTVIEDKSGNSHVKGLTTQIANNEEEALNLLFEGETNRSIAEHQLNKSSTRSHCIFTMYLEARSRVESSEKVISSKLNLVDLAGSERTSKTQTNGVSLKEAMYINKSLTFLEQVIIALADKRRDHIPYRQSKLTHVLRDSLGGNCNTLMIANVWGEKDHVEETISTLRFATRMMCVTNTPHVNVQFDPMALIKKYEREIKELKQELSMHDSLSNRSHVNYEAFGESQRLELQKQVKAFLEDDDAELEIVSLRHIREFVNQMKILYKSLELERDERDASLKKIMTSGAVPSSDKTQSDMGDMDNMRQNGDFDDGVGDSEMAGFSVGLAPGSQNSRANANRKSKVKKPSKQSPISPSFPAAPDWSQSSHQDHEDDESYETSTGRDGQSSRVGLSNEEPTTQLPPLPGQPQFTKAIRLPQTAASRADEFENFKKGKGAEINRILCENKAALKEKKRIAKELVENINEWKNNLDRIKAEIDGKRKGKPENDSVDLIIDEEEYELLEKLKTLKHQYREQFETLKQTRLDIQYCTKLVDQCRQKLMSDFEQWYEGIYGSQIPDLDAINGQSEDVMDIGEKFDRLQMERMSQEDPDSLPYYNARKNTERRILKVGLGLANRGQK
ncbi:Kinesin-like protein kif9 [Chytridiales sp. JEL 0842]|nr:Kinesin-like protein kif9 [Chytridiales sp. JEL 0842]